VHAEYEKVKLENFRDYTKRGIHRTTAKHLTYKKTKKRMRREGHGGKTPYGGDSNGFLYERWPKGFEGQTGRLERNGFPGAEPFRIANRLCGSRLKGLASLKIEFQGSDGTNGLWG